MNIAIIPARAGSKGLKKKNIRPLCGKPLILHTVIAALESNLIDKVLVSTDDEEVKKIVEQYDLEVIDRPKELAEDHTPTLPVLTHAIDQIEGHISCIVVLQPTSPLRSSKQIDEAINLYNDQCSSIISVCVAEHSPYKMFNIKNKYLQDFISKKWRGMPRQKLPTVYRENGAIYVTSVKNLLSGDIAGRNPRPFLMSSETSVDIDTFYDLCVAETIINSENDF